MLERGSFVLCVLCLSTHPRLGYTGEGRNCSTPARSLLFCLLHEIPILGLRASETHSRPTAELNLLLVSILRYRGNRCHTDKPGIPCALKHHIPGNSAKAILALHGYIPCSPLPRLAMKNGSGSFELKKMGTGRSQDSLASHLV